MIAVVLGRPISGGSALAAAIVAMGYHPGLTIFGPCAPNFRPDWEDAEITAGLIAGARPDEAQWREIMETRLAQAAQLGCAGALMKSPMFCLAGPPFFAALKHFRHEIFWVSRDEKDRKTALKSYAPASRKLLNEIDEEIDQQMLVDPDLGGADVYINYEELLQVPAETLSVVAELLGAEDRLGEAVAAIGPRRLSPCRP